MYISSVDSGNLSSFVFFSMFMTVIPLFSSISGLFTRYCGNDTQFIESRFKHAPKYKCNFTLKSVAIKKKHSYANNKMEESIYLALNRSHDAELYKRHKRYVLSKIEVYWMNGRKGGMDVYFDLTIAYNARRRGDELAKKMYGNITQMMRETSPDNERFKKTLAEKLNLASYNRIVISRFECVNGEDIEEWFRIGSYIRSRIRSSMSLSTSDNNDIDTREPGRYSIKNDINEASQLFVPINLQVAQLEDDQLSQLIRCCSAWSKKFNVLFFNCVYLFINIWCDIIFALILLLEHDVFSENILSTLYIFSFIFIVASYLLSFIVSLLFIRRWKKMTKNYPQRLIYFSEKYGLIMILLTLFSSFYSVIDLCCSKILNIHFTNLPIKIREYRALQLWKLINVLLLEVCLCLVYYFIVMPGCKFFFVFLF